MCAWNMADQSLSKCVLYNNNDFIQKFIGPVSDVRPSNLVSDVAENGIMPMPKNMKTARLVKWKRYGEKILFMGKHLMM